MASRPNFKGEASASSNIVRLPTAASSKVNNFRYADQRRTAVSVSKECRFNYIRPEVRRCLDAARAYCDAPATPALAIASELFAKMGKVDRARVYASLRFKGEALNWETSRIGAAVLLVDSIRERRGDHTPQQRWAMEQAIEIARAERGL